MLVTDMAIVSLLTFALCANHLVTAAFTVNTYAALGDSYVAGPSAGDSYDDTSECRRFTQSYPPLVSQSKDIVSTNPRSLKFIACSGAKSVNIYETPQAKLTTTQATDLKGLNPEMTTITIGGNDVKFVDVLDRCIYRFQQVGCGRCTIPSSVQDDCTTDCNEALDALAARIASPDFANSLQKTYASIFENAPQTKLYVIGYPRFWNADTDQCDRVSFKTFCSNNDILPLTKARRQRMNDLTNKMNAVITTVVNSARVSDGKPTYFVDPNGAYEGHRFCESGVNEPSYQNPNTWFYPFEYFAGNTLMIDASTILSTTTDCDASSDPGDYYACELTAGLQANGSSLDLSHWGNNVAGGDDLGTLSSGSSLPNFLARIFHPTKAGFAAISDTIIQAYLGTDTSTTGNSPGADRGQQIALATYIDPGANPDVWKRLIAFPANKVSVLVANVVNGPDSAVDPNWTGVIQQAAASGKSVLGYVRTGYLGVSFQQFTTRLGSSQTSDWVAQIQEDVDQWYRLYPGIGGIFFDEGWNDCGADNINAELYKFITQSTKRKYSGALTVLNPGAPMPQCFEQSADTLLTYEGSYETYTSGGYVPNTWTPSDPRKIWHIIFDVPAGQGPAVAAMALQRGAGMVEITNDVEPNPYDTLPDAAYMQGLMDAVPGGKPLNEGIFPFPGGPSVVIPGAFHAVTFDYSSVTLSWSTSVNAVGYQIYQNGVMALSLTPSMTTVTVGGLTPGSPYTFTIVALNGDGSQTGTSNPVSITTLSLPSGGKTVSSTSFTASATQTIYKARILVPYAFVRVFMWYSDVACDWEKSPGWPINFNSDTYVCNNYVVEGGTLYHYSGVIDDSTINAPWSWTSVAEVPIVQSGYDYTWTVPIGTSTIDPSQYVIQVQGYGPMANVFHPCEPYIAGSTATLARYCG